MNQVDSMQGLKHYFVKNFEQAFVLLILVSVTSIVYFLPYKLSFLNFFYLPILLTAYYLGTRSAVLGSILTFLMVASYAYIFPDVFLAGRSQFEMWASITTWASFLILTSTVVGYTHRQLQEKITEAIKVRAELTGNKALLEETSKALEDMEDNLDDKVQKRTSAIEESAQAIKDHKEKVEEALYATMDPSVVKLMIEKRIRTENRQISVQFCDLKGFTQYSDDNSADVVITELNNYLAEMESILLQYHAHIDKYMGDGIMTEFGAPDNYSKHALLAVAAGWKMQEAMTKGNYPWSLRVGIATGVATTGIIGAKRQSYTAFGDTVNLASRIEGMCEPGRVTVDETTYEECRKYFEFTSKTVSSYKQIGDPEALQKIDEVIAEISDQPDNVNLYMRAGKLLLQANDIEKAREYYKQAMTIAPDNNKVKLAYADAAVKEDKERNISIRGKKKSLHLYEMTGIKDALKNFNRFPKSLYEDVHEQLDKLVPYPEDFILPVECLDGSVGFSKIIGVIAYLMAYKMDLPDQEKHDILEAGYLAEIGKTIVPENILNRQGSLTTDEFDSIRMHPRESVRKLKSMGYENADMLSIIECHHENFDGSGYPAGLKGEKIPLGAKIVSVAEAFTSLTSVRPYRDAWESHTAYKELLKFTDRGKFDPDIIKILGDVVNQL